VLVDGFTRAEVTLIERGKAEQVLALRRSFQDAMAPEFRGVVEEAVGRPVVAFMSQVNIDPDLSTEIFFLDQPGGRGEVTAG
jgi:uncharacterized protein YbcI